MCPMTTAPRGASPLDLVGVRDVVYRTLLGSPRAGTADVATAAEVTRAEARRVLRALVADGLVVRDEAPDQDDDERWRAVPPRIALGDGVQRLRADLERAEHRVAELADLARTAEAHGVGGLVEVVSGQEAQARAIAEVEHGARRSNDLFQTGANTVASVAASITPDREPSRIPYRVVVDSAFLTEPAAVRALDERVAVGHRVRVVEHPLVKLAVADGEVAMFQVDPMTSLVLRGPLVRLAVELFETTWRRSRPYLREGAGPSRDDRQLLHLMISGLTDAAMASQLDTSPRTVQRRIRALMDTAEVGTRLQLGWYALRHDWV
jgi:hypothetical protein